MNFTPLFRGHGGRITYFWVPDNTTAFGDIFQFSYNPYVGLEYERVLDAKVDSVEGTTVRFAPHLRTSLWPAPIALNLKLEFVGDFQWRYDLTRPADVGDRYHPYKQLSLNYWLLNDDDQKAGFGLDFIDGEEPRTAFKDQSLWRLSIKLRF